MPVSVTQRLKFFCFIIYGSVTYAAVDMERRLLVKETCSLMLNRLISCPFILCNTWAIHISKYLSVGRILDIRTSTSDGILVPVILYFSIYCNVSTIVHSGIFS